MDKCLAPFLLVDPLTYKGNEILTIYPKGNPFGKGIESLFETLSKEIPMEVVDKPERRLKLNQETCDNLYTEALGYSVRVGFFIHPDMDYIYPLKALADMDQITRIVHMISIHAEDERTRKVFSEFQKVMSIENNVVLASCAEITKNYGWAEQLLNGGKQTLEGIDLLCCHGLIEAFYAHRSEEWKKTYKYKRESIPIQTILNSNLHRINKLKEEEKQPQYNIVAVHESPPNCYTKLLQGAVENENYEFAAKLRTEIEQIKTTVSLSEARPFVRWVGEYMLLNIFPRGVKYELSDGIPSYNLKIQLGKNMFGDQIKVDDDGVLEPRIMLPDNESLKKEYLPYVLGLVHRLPFVLRFDRWNTLVEIGYDSDHNYLFGGPIGKVDDFVFRKQF